VIGLDVECAQKKKGGSSMEEKKGGGIAPAKEKGSCCRAREYLGKRPTGLEKNKKGATAEKKDSQAPASKR